MGEPSACKSGCAAPPVAAAAFRPEAAAFRPEAAAFRPEAAAFRPEAEAFRTEEEAAEAAEVACPLFLARGARPGRRALALAGALVEACDAPGEEEEEEAREGEVCAGTLDHSTPAGVVRGPSVVARIASAVGSRLVSRRLGGRPVRHDPLAAAPRRGRSAAVGEAQVLMRLWGGL
jgi:hypothetical protein